MRIESAPEVRQRLLFMLAAAQREPALVRRRKHLPVAQECEALQHFCDEVAARPQARGLTEEMLAEVLAE